MKSKFTFKAFLFPVITIFLLIVSIKTIMDNYPIDFLMLRWIDYFMIILFTITFFWLIKLEMLRKMLVIEFDGTSIKTTNFLNIKSINSINSLIGFKTQINATRMGNFEETIIINKNNNEIIISEFYIANYSDLKIQLVNKLKDYGGARKNAL